MNGQYRAAFLSGLRKLDMGFMPVPSVKSNEVMVRIHQANVCPTDLKKYYNLDEKSNAALQAHGHVILGHEASGLVEIVGETVHGFKHGDRVAIDPMLPCGYCEFCLAGDFPLCRNLRGLGVSAGSVMDAQQLLEEGIGGVFAEFVKVPATNLYLLPDGLGFEAGAMMEPLSDVLHSLEAGHPQTDETVVVFGLGAMGLMHVQVMHSWGISNIVGIDPIAARREKAHQFGAKLTIDPGSEDPVSVLKDYTHGLGADLIYICAGGNAQTGCTLQALKAIRKKGRILLYASALKPSEISVDINQIHYSMIQFTGTVGFYPRHASQALEYLLDRRIDVEAIRTPCLPLEELEEAFHLSQQSNVLKVGIKVANG